MGHLNHNLRALGLALSLVAAAVGQERANPLPRGERLLGEFNCVACHAASPAVEGRLASQLAPHLDQVAARVTPGYLRRYLADPFGTNPMGRMPDQLAGLSEVERASAAENLTHFLMGLGEPLDRAPTSAHLASLERGRRVFHGSGCVACHRPQEELWELDWTLAELFAEQEAEPDGSSAEEPEPEPEAAAAPGVLEHPDVPLELDWLAGKTTVAGLAAFLEDPLAVRPSGRMPDMGLDRDEARDVARYLLRGQTTLREWRYEEAGGLAFEYFEQPFTSHPIEWDSFIPKATGGSPGFDITRRERDEHFGFRWQGMIRVPEDDTYTFWTTSDDGSHLWIDGEHVVANGGDHGPQTVQGSIELDEGRHAIAVTFYENGGGEELTVEWSGSGGERGPIPADVLSHAGLVHRPDASPFVRDESKARAGAKLFVSLDCVNCHTTGDEQVDGARESQADPLADLEPTSGQACLGNRIRFERAGDRAAVGEALAHVADLESILAPGETLLRELDRLNCLACHRRGDVGGTHPKVRDYFLADESAELGDEGRIPPHLSQTGAKLRRPWLSEVLLRGGRARPYMHTRMPQFGEANVGGLIDLFIQADPAPPEPKQWDVSTGALADGHRLVGAGALGCIQCHTFDGQRSLGVQAVDLTTMTDHLRYGWFKQLLLEPAALNMDTRMPSFWPDGQSPVDLYGGDPEGQIEAVWTFLSLGKGMALPKGLAGGGQYELTPSDGPITCGVFMAGVSPRTLLVGFPERIHYAFDMQSPRVAKLWRGRFFNARGTWQGRAGALESPPSDDVLELPPGPALALLGGVGDEWPRTSPRPLGRRFDDQRVPILRYAVGPVRVEERLEPVLRFGGSGMRRVLTLSAARPVHGLWFRPFSWSGGGEGWSAPTEDDGALNYTSMDPPVTLRIEGAPAPTPVIGRGVDLLIPVRLQRAGARYEAHFSVEVSW
jgi:mono/diheme cytochrome c family protein